MRDKQAAHDAETDADNVVIMVESFSSPEIKKPIPTLQPQAISQAPSPLQYFFYKVPTPQINNELYSIRFNGYRFGYEIKENNATLFTFLQVEDTSTGTPKKIIDELYEMIKKVSENSTKTGSTTANRLEVTITIDTTKLPLTNLLQLITKRYNTAIYCRKIYDPTESEPAAGPPVVR